MGVEEKTFINIDEERRKIIERVKKEIEDPEKAADVIEKELDKIEYNEYFAYNTHLKSETYLIITRRMVDESKDLDFDSYISEILSCCNMTTTGGYDVQIFLVVNVNKKFTFLNSIDQTNIIERGLTKMRREYGNEWDERDEEIYKIVATRLR